MRLVALLLLLAPAIAIADEAPVSRILYMNRCRGGCLIRGGVDDARAMTSSLPCAAGGAVCTSGQCTCNTTAAGDYPISEFKDGAGNTGDAATPEWDQIVQCVREVYSPYNIQIVDQLPPDGTPHTLAIVAGTSAEIGIPSNSGGIAPGTGCGPRDNVVSFSFANSSFYAGTGMRRVWQICGVVAQETGHAFGLDHAFQFVDGSPTCNDPMTYRPMCGQQFFRNDFAQCGEFAVEGCGCGGLQNSHAKLMSIFGPGTPLTTPPQVTVTFPAPDSTVGAGAAVSARASAQRGIARIDLWINGYKWNSVEGAAFGSNGQPETTYTLLIPTAVPDSILDIVVKAYDDIEVETVAPTLTVTKGAAGGCQSADTCALGQSCENGRCFWPEPTGVDGDACEYPQFCVSGNCVETTDGRICSSQCVVGVADSCPMDFECAGNAGETGFCVPMYEDPGCCSVGGDRRAAMVLSLGVLGLVLRRRRRR